jgi:hypothetical protein
MARRLNPVTGMYEDVPDASLAEGKLNGQGTPNVPVYDAGAGAALDPSAQPDPVLARSTDPTLNPQPPAAAALPVPPADPTPVAPAPAPTTPALPPQPTTPTPPPDGSGVAAPSVAPAAASGSGLSDLVNEKVRMLLNTPQTLNTTELMASPEAAAERLQNQRSTERLIANTAEQAAYGGTTGGGTEGVMRGIKGKQSETDAIFLGQLAAQFRQRQIDDLKFGIQTAIQMGQFDKAQALQERLTLIQSDTSRQNTMDSVGLGYASLQEQANEAALKTLLSLGAGA